MGERGTAKKNAGGLPPKLTAAEQDLWEKIELAYQLETDSLGGNPLLRRLKDDDVIRPVSVNRNTIKAMEERGLTKQAKGKDPLTIMWRLVKKRQ